MADPGKEAREAHAKVAALRPRVHEAREQYWEARQKAEDDLNIVEQDYWLAIQESDALDVAIRAVEGMKGE